MGTDKNGLYDKEPSVMETHIGRFHHVDAHDKTERSARILVARLLPRSLLLPGIMGKKFVAAEVKGPHDHRVRVAAER